MNWIGPEFVLAIIAMSTAGWLVNNWIRAKHGYALENEWWGQSERPDTQEARELRAENAELRTALVKVDRRMQVLERIVTHKGFNVAEQIESLRDQRRADNAEAGVPAGIEQRERV